MNRLPTHAEILQANIPENENIKLFENLAVLSKCANDSYTYFNLKRSILSTIDMYNKLNPQQA